MVQSLENMMKLKNTNDEGIKVLVKNGESCTKMQVWTIKTLSKPDLSPNLIVAVFASNESDSDSLTNIVSSAA